MCQNCKYQDVKCDFLFYLKLKSQNKVIKRLKCLKKEKDECVYTSWVFSSF